jgi:hypothetical protein
MPAESEKIQSGTHDIFTVELTYDILIVRPQDSTPVLTQSHPLLTSRYGASGAAQIQKTT